MEEALVLNAMNKNTFWDDVIAKEMKNFIMTVKILPKGDRAPTSCQFAECNMVFDIKIKDFLPHNGSTWRTLDLKLGSVRRSHD